MQWFAWTPLLAVLSYAVVLTRHFADLVRDINSNADSIAPMILATALRSAASPTHVYLGAEGSYTTLWFDRLTLALPWHRQLWEVAPYGLALLTLALLVWTSHRVAGRWAAVATGAVIFCATPVVLYGQMAQANRVTTWFSTALLAAFLALSTSPGRRPPRQLLLGIVVTTVTGLNLASDPLLAAAGLLPLCTAAAVHWLRRRDRRNRQLLTAALFISAGASVIALALTLLMVQAGFRTVPPAAAFATEDQLGRNLSLWVTIVLQMGNGDLFGLPLNLHSLLTATCAVTVVAAVVVMMRSGNRWLRTPDNGGEAEVRRSVLVAFWFTSAAAVTVAMVTSTVATDVSAVRYLIPILMAAATLVPLSTHRRLPSRVIVAAGITLIGVMSVRALQATERTHGFRVDLTRDMAPVVDLLEHEGATRGYAGYWNSNLLTWRSGGRLATYPIAQGQPCGGQDPNALCAFHLNTLESWYRPHGGSSFLLQDAEEGHVPLPPQPGLGVPSSVVRLGHRTVYVFPFDIADHLRPCGEPAVSGSPPCPPH